MRTKQREITVFLILAFSLIMQFCNAQGNLKFEKKKIELGEIPDNGISEWKVFFENTGDKPLVIVRVGTNHGGLYAKKPVGFTGIIKPGEKSYVIINYDLQRIGSFERELRIDTSYNNDGYKIMVSGIVIKNLGNLGPDSVPLSGKKKIDTEPTTFSERWQEDRFGELGWRAEYISFKKSKSAKDSTLLINGVNYIGYKTIDVIELLGKNDNGHLCERNLKPPWLRKGILSYRCDKGEEKKVVNFYFDEKESKIYKVELEICRDK